LGRETKPMSVSTETVLRQALELPANDRAALVDELIVSLDKPDAALDVLWLKEAESRLAAYRSGELGAVDADEVFSELGKQT
jgi:putative addiction module component (TIGR02574 family)